MLTPFRFLYINEACNFILVSAFKTPQTERTCRPADVTSRTKPRLYPLGQALSLTPSHW